MNGGEESPGRFRAGRKLLLLAFLVGPLIQGVGLSLTPDARGHGTHEQLGMAPCAFPAVYGIPCPTCGVTTSFSYAARLAIVPAIRAQPFGTLLFLGVQLLSLLALICLVTGRSPSIPTLTSRRGLLAALALVVLLLAGWAFKIATWSR